MMVTFISQCEKNALKRTRRVLDAFANRIGDNTWQTLITQDGLDTVNKMLRKTASRSTAVSCHWIRSRSRTQLLWIVGNKKQFNSVGMVPVNRTEQDLIIKEQFALNTEIIANLAAIAGFFHDIGKANLLFQTKLGAYGTKQLKTATLNHDIQHRFREPLRHEWISMRMFQAFVGEKTDKEWLEALTQIDDKAERELVKSLPAFKDFCGREIPNPMLTLPPVANLVAWLIVSHHRLPQFPAFAEDNPPLDKIAQWKSVFEPRWNAPHSIATEWSQSDIQDNFSFPFDTPLSSAFWQAGVRQQAKRALKSKRLFETDWHNNLFTQHISRLALMLADHAESSISTTNNELSDPNYLAYANTGKDETGNRCLKQKLDEHNIKVGKLAYHIACNLPSLKSNLSKLERCKPLESTVPRSLASEFGWQDKAYELAKALKDCVDDYGFFGISMASTGKGKTRANAKIMYALSEQGHCRFNVALGLRTLSIQTASALRRDLFGKDKKSQQTAQKKIALLVGSQAVRDLHELDIKLSKCIEGNQTLLNGSESAEPLLKDEVDVLGEHEVDGAEYYEWLHHDNRILKLLDAPILVSTIDYLMPATEGVRGGRQIAPMLRLLSSDLVLDEPDDFGSDDFKAQCRLVNWAGMLGCKVLISTATIMPCEAKALFDAYQHGRAEYTKANGEKGEQKQVCCAWFDECNQPKSEVVSNPKLFSNFHNAYAVARQNKLAKQDAKLRQAKLVDVTTAKFETYSQAMAYTIYQSITELHNHHYVKVADKQVSVGLVRMANINPLVQVAKHLMSINAPEDTCIHYCIYHGRYPLLQRSSIEQVLDKALNRHDFSEWAQNSGIQEVVIEREEKKHIFVVIATSVAEVGRDHDYDWAIVEPSSMRSIIQLAGRVQRHRKQTPKTHNIHVLTQNYKGLRTNTCCFTRPGAETELFRYASNNLNELEVEEALESISATSRILKPINPSITSDIPPKFKRFSQLEHFRQEFSLYGSKRYKNYAALWWENDVSWCGEIQRMQPFRKSRFNKDYCLRYSERTRHYIWMEKKVGVFPATYTPTHDIKTLDETVELAEGNCIWHRFELAESTERISEQTGKSEKLIYEFYTHFSLQEYESTSINAWHYQPEFGIYKQLDRDKLTHDN